MGREDTIARLQGRKPLTAESQVLVDDQHLAASRAAAIAVLEAQDAVELAPNDEAREEARGRLQAAEQTAANARAQLDADVVVLKFEGLAPELFQALIDEHPPTEEQQEKSLKRGLILEWNPRTFPPALIAATCVDPGFDSAEQVLDTFYRQRRFSETETDDIFAAALATCRGRREVPDWGKGSGETPG